MSLQFSDMNAFWNQLENVQKYRFLGPSSTVAGEVEAQRICISNNLLSKPERLKEVVIKQKKAFLSCSPAI